MLCKILVGLDNTKASVAAMRLGVHWARRCGASLVGLAVVDEPGIRAIEPVWPVGGKPGVDPVYYMGYEARLAAVEHQVRQLLKQFADRCEEKGVAHAELLRSGSPDEHVREEAQSCDLVVLGRGSQFRFITGDDEADDTLKRVLKDAPRPVLIAPPAVCSSGPTVIAYEGSLQAARTLAAFAATGFGESGKVHVVSVSASLSEATHNVESARKILGAHRIESAPHAVTSSAPPAQVILDLAGQLNAGLIVAALSGQPVLREFFLGSVTRTLLAESPVPLFLYH